ncbi:unnamed protein product [Polarella glacialis]|nr:unnamed protein product [Polarella glacialis]
MPGRPEHTDKMKHHGTWHVQLSGCKEWYLRATSELLQAAGLLSEEGEGEPEEACRHVVRCSAGDVLVVNTRLWWHSTKLPGSAGQPLSLSYARDFVISAAASGAAGAARTAASAGLVGDEEEDEDEQDTGVDVNVDGMLAKSGIKKGSVIMMAEEMPERKKTMSVPDAPNCMVRGSELVAVKDIASGDLFLVLGFESDEEDKQRMHMRTFVL